MGRRGYPKPKYLPEKLLAIRRQLGLSQTQMARQLDFPGYYTRISEFESGRRQPSVLVLLAYARVAGISTDDLIDDGKEIALTKDASLAIFL